MSPPLQHPNIDHFGPMYNSGGQFGVEALQIGLERHMKGEEWDKIDGEMDGWLFKGINDIVSFLLCN